MFVSLIGSFVQSMQFPGLRSPTLEECLEQQSGMEEERRADAILRLATVGDASSKVPPDDASHAAQSPEVAKKKRCITSKARGV